MEPTSVVRLSRVEFEQLSADEQSEHVQDTLAALRKAIPHGAADAGAFIDVRLYVQELVGWAPTEVERHRAFHRAGIESNASQIHAAFQEALDNGSLSPEQAQLANNSLEAEKRIVDIADEYV